jgi:hypothetical protein
MKNIVVSVLIIVAVAGGYFLFQQKSTLSEGDVASSTAHTTFLWEFDSHSRRNNQG